MSFSKLRIFWLRLHRVLALIVGLGFVLQGLTGCISLFRDEIDQWLNPVLIIEPQSQAYLSLDQLLLIVKQAEPDRHGVWTLEMPRRTNEPLTAWFDKPRETIGAFYAPLMVSINPWSGEILAKRFWGQTIVTQLLDLHSHWWLEAQGRRYLPILAVLLLLSCVSGLILWWPGWRDLLGTFRIRRTQLISDTHRMLGLISASGLIIMAFTGFHLAYPQPIESLTGSQGMGHGDEGAIVRSTAIPGERAISLNEAVLIARGPFSQAQLRRISTPLGDAGTFKINFHQSQELNQRHPLTTVWLDRWSGQIRDVRNPNRFSAGQRFSSALWPVHTSEALGSWGRALWFLLGVSPLLLYISGLWMLLRRRP